MNFVDFFGIRSFRGEVKFTAYNPNFSLKIATKKVPLSVIRISLMLVTIDIAIENYVTKQIILENFLRISTGPFKIIDG